MTITTCFGQIAVSHVMMSWNTSRTVLVRLQLESCMASGSLCCASCYTHSFQRTPSTFCQRMYFRMPGGGSCLSCYGSRWSYCVSPWYPMRTCKSCPTLRCYGLYLVCLYM
eukprot:PhF_6_TR23236/c1_g2_i6/m.32548